MSDYFQQPDEEEKREYLRRELERMERLRQMNGAQAMPTPPPSGMSPELSPYRPTPIGGLYSPDLEGQQAPIGPIKEDELQKMIEMIMTGRR